MDSSLQCKFCHKMFVTKASCRRHIDKKVCQNKLQYINGRVTCELCGSKFSRPYNLQRHQQFAHGLAVPTGGQARGGAVGLRQQVLICGMCPKMFASKQTLDAHRATQHQLRSRFQLVKSAHRRACEVYRLVYPDDVRTMEDAVGHVTPHMTHLLRKLIAERKFFKAGFLINIRFRKAASDEEDDGEEDAAAADVVDGLEGVDVMTLPLRSSMHTIMQGTDLEAVVGAMIGQVLVTFDDFLRHGSGWVLTDCLNVDVEIAECKPLRGSGCLQHKLVYSTQNETLIQSSDDQDVHDGRCFLHAVASYFLMQQQIEENPNIKKEELRTQSIPQLEHFIAANICDNVETPVRVEHISKFEEGNKHLDIAINVLYACEKDIIPVSVSRNINAKNIVNLMLMYTQNPILSDSSDTSMELEEGEKEGESVMHYVLIDDMKKLLSWRQKTGEHWYTTPKHLCYNCMNCFVRETAFADHVQWCHQESCQRQIVPQKGTKIKYLKKNKEFKLGYTFFFDFETLQRKPEKVCSCKVSENGQKDDKCTHKSFIVTEQEAFAYSFVMIDRDGTVVEDLSYVGEDADVKFVHLLVEMNDKYTEEIQKVEPINMTDKDIEDFATATTCHICEKALLDDRVRDHDHMSGSYVGAAHNACNLKRSECVNIVGFAHNFSGYDSHIVVNAVAKMNLGNAINMSAIPLNTQKFKMIKLNNITMLDSMSFLNASLEKLVETLVKSNHPFNIIRQWLDDENKVQKLLQKGVYPYEFVTNLNRVNTTMSLPPKRKFHSRLTGKHISNKDYAHAQSVWETFGCDSLRDYTELYCRADTYQLAEVFTQLRDSVYEEFEIDACHYLSLPMLAKDIMLKHTGVEMELMSDIDMIQFIRTNIRGGLSYVNHRYFNKEEESEKKGKPMSLAYVDANNLYGAAMRMPLPLGDYQWMSQREIDDFTLAKINENNGARGYILEVTLEYPEDLHIDHSSFPLAPHQMDITEADLSVYASNVMQELTKKKKYKARKLTSTFLKREKYVCHGRNLKLYLEKGLRLVKVHRGISFVQSDFLKSYIDMCTQKRAEAKTKAAGNIMKLLCNSLYGKMIENGSNRMDCRFVMNKKQAVSRNTDPRFKSSMIIAEDFSIAFMGKKETKLNQSWAVGFSILELSKFVMQSLMYDKVKPTFGGEVSVILTDTDSWVLAVPAESSDQAMIMLEDVMDFSNYPEDHPLHDSCVKNLTGFLKNETPGQEITEVVGVRSKTYAIKMQDESVSTRCKGVKRAAKENIMFDSYKKCVTEVAQQNVTQYCIQSKNHINRLLRCKKVAFSSFDDKRYLLCGIHSVPYGSCLIEKSKTLGGCYFCLYPRLTS